MKRVLPSAYFLCILVLGLMTVRSEAEDTPLFHYSVHESTQTGPQPLGFPFGLMGGQSRDSVTAVLPTAGFHRGDYDKDNTVWTMHDKIVSKTFKPSAFTLKYVNDKLMQVTLVEPNVSDCNEIVAIIQDAVAYVKSNFTFPPENAAPEPHFNSNSCVFYMKPGQSGWQTWVGDYAVDMESNWRDGKEMVYSAYMTFTYIPLYNSSVKK
jgi:hypothetical protein